AELTGIPHGSAKKIWAQYKKTGSTSNCRRSGRPKKIDERMGCEIVREVQKNQCKPFQEIGNELEPKVSATAVWEFLAGKGYHRRVPFLKKDQKVKRKDWAEFVKGIDWSGVIWSDECYVYLGDKASQVFVTHREDEEYEEDCLIPTFKQSSIRVMIWACIMKGKKGPLVVLEYPGGKGGGIMAARYQEQVLEPVFLQFWETMKLERDGIAFQQDGAPCHSAKSTITWL
ncbi:hypothetical protein F5890DRAFT_1386928, partial [Lentinula detonsa]